MIIMNVCVHKTLKLIVLLWLLGIIQHPVLCGVTAQKTYLNIETGKRIIIIIVV